MWQLDHSRKERGSRNDIIYDEDDDYDLYEMREKRRRSNSNADIQQLRFFGNDEGDDMDYNMRRSGGLERRRSVGTGGGLGGAQSVTTGGGGGGGLRYDI